MKIDEVENVMLDIINKITIYPNEKSKFKH